MNMLATIVPKSTQLNSDDLIGRDLTITITKVTVDLSAEQQVAVYFEGDNNKPWMVCKSMRRVLVQAWGPDASAYDGRSLTLYRDPDVKFGGMDVGGIRISSMSHITKRLVMALTATRGNKKLFTVEVLKVEAPSAPVTDKNLEATDRLIARIQACQTEDALHAISGDVKIADWRTKVRKARPELEARIAEAFGATYQTLVVAGQDAQPKPVPPADDPVPSDEVPF